MEMIIIIISAPYIAYKILLFEILNRSTFEDRLYHFFDNTSFAICRSKDTSVITSGSQPLIPIAALYDLIPDLRTFYANYRRCQYNPQLQLMSSTDWPDSFSFKVFVNWLSLSLLCFITV